MTANQLRANINFVPGTIEVLAMAAVACSVAR